MWIIRFVGRVQRNEASEGFNSVNIPVRCGGLRSRIGRIRHSAFVVPYGKVEPARVKVLLRFINPERAAPLQTLRGEEILERPDGEGLWTALRLYDSRSKRKNRFKILRFLI